MKVKFFEDPIKSSIQIDPLTSANQTWFAPLVAVTTYHIDKTTSHPPVVVITFCGKLDPPQANRAGKALKLAALLCEKARASGNMKATYTEYTTAARAG